MKTGVDHQSRAVYVRIVKRKTQGKSGGEQVIMSGVITEADMMRKLLKQMGSKGGSVNSPAQRAHRVRVIGEVNARKRSRMKAK